MPDPLPTAKFNHAALNCRDVRRSVAFYRQVLGFHETPRPGFDFVGAWLYRDGLGMMLHLIEDKAYSPLDHELNTRRSHLAFRVNDVDMALELLNQHGVEFVQRRLPDHAYRQVFFSDPDGNVIEVGEWPHVEHMVEASAD